MYGTRITKTKPFLKETENIIITETILSTINKELNEYEDKLKGIQNIGKFVGIFVRNNLDDYYNRIVKNVSFGNARTLEKNINLYGEIEGTKRWDAYRNKQAYTNSKEYKGMTDEEFNTYNKSRAVTLDNLIRRHGVDGGTKIWNEYRARQSYTNTEEYFIEQYGEVDGSVRYREINKLKTHSLDSYVERYGDIKGRQKWDDYVTHSSPTFYSEISQEFIRTLDDMIKITFDVKSYYATLNNEFGKYSIKQSKYFKYDYVILYNDVKICIEFNGDDWHCNPNKYSSNDYQKVGSKLLVESVWYNDKIKEELMIEDGFHYFILWESDYKNNKNGTVNHFYKIVEGLLNGSKVL